MARLIATGDGYQNCTAFDGYKIIAAPLPGYSNAEREARVFRRKGGGGTDYGSHVLALAVRENATPYCGTDSLYLLVSHGGGREVWTLRTFYDGGAYQAALLAMPERLQYAALYTLYSTASEARSGAIEETTRKYSAAFVEGRLKKSRRKQGCVRVFIEPCAAVPSPARAEG